MENRPQKDFGKRKLAAPSVAARSAPPAKRSGHVGLLLMGTLAVGGGAYALMPSENCQPTQPSVASSAGSTQCSRGGSSSGGGGGSSRSGFYSSDSSSSHPVSGTSSDAGSSGVSRGGFGSFAHAFSSHFSGGG
jgi:hypothetical protein